MKPLNLLKLAILVYFSSSNLIYSQIAYSNLEPDTVFQSIYSIFDGVLNYSYLDVNGYPSNDVVFRIYLYLEIQSFYDI